MTRRLLALAVFLAGCSLVASPRTIPPSDAPPSEPVDAPAVEPAGVQPVRTFSEVRALWVVRTTLTSAAAIRAMVERAEKAGFNSLIVQVRGRGDAYYRSSWEPRAVPISEGAAFDPLALVIELAHERGMAVHAWVNTHIVWGAGALPRSSRHIVRAHPEWLAVPKALGRELYDMDPRDPKFVARLRWYARENSEAVEGLYTSPSDPDVKERIRSVWLDLSARYDLDGIHFDYVRFPSEDFDYSRGALDRFRRWVSPRLPPQRREELRRAAENDPYAYVDALPGPWAEFRRTHVTELVRWIYHGVKARRPQLVISAAVFANQDDALHRRFQEWPVWLEEGILDVAVPMAYTNDDERFRRFIRGGVEIAGSNRLWAGIGAYMNGSAGTLDQIDIARSEQASGVVLFSYDWAMGAGRDSEGLTLLERVGQSKFGR